MGTLGSQAEIGVWVQTPRGAFAGVGENLERYVQNICP